MDYLIMLLFWVLGKSSKLLVADIYLNKITKIMTSEQQNVPKPKVAIRFFDTARSEDFERLKEIVDSPGVKQWMSDLKGMGTKHFYQWMEEQGYYNYYLFAVVIAEQGNPEYDKVQGFIYLYPCEWERGSLEVSFAKKPGAPSGLITPGLRLACEKVQELYTKKTKREKPPLRILAEIEPNNMPSMRVVWGAGFEEDEEYEDDNAIYVLNWDRLRSIQN